MGTQYLPHPILPLVDQARHGNALGRTFLLYHYIQREEGRSRDARHALAEYLVEYAELCDEHLGETLAAVQLTDHQGDHTVQQYQTLTETVRAVEQAIRENIEARRHLWFFPIQ